LTGKGYCPDLDVTEKDALYRVATNGRQSLRNKGAVNGVNQSNADAGYRLPIPDKTLSGRSALSELLLNFVVVRRDGRENER
jgi:hypothetical protein